MSTTMMRKWGVLLGLTAGVTLLVAAARAQDFKPLFNGKNLKGWKTFYRKNKDGSVPDSSKTLTVKDGMIQVSGFPYGFFYTDKPYKNYVLRYTWRYPKEQPKKTTMNSGCLIHIQMPLKVWPRSIEPQCRYKDHGKIFFIGLDKKKYKTMQDFNEKAQKKALKPHYEWNTTEVTSNADGSFEVRINGVLVNKGKSTLTSGPIGFQSEGARIDFKDIQLKQR